MALSGEVEPLISPIPGESCPLLWAALVPKIPQRVRRRKQESHLEWFRLRGHHGQVLRLLAQRLWSRERSCLPTADARWLLLGLEEQKCHKISCFCQVLAVCEWHLSNSAAAHDAACQGLLRAALLLPWLQLPTPSPLLPSLEAAFTLGPAWIHS